MLDLIAAAMFPNAAAFFILGYDQSLNLFFADTPWDLPDHLRPDPPGPPLRNYRGSCWFCGRLLSSLE